VAGCAGSEAHGLGQRGGQLAVRLIRYDSLAERAVGGLLNAAAEAHAAVVLADLDAFWSTACRGAR
jgi:hypothetical protein